MSKAIENKNILISGASIAGPALAWWLKHYGFNVTVVEKAPFIRKGGYRIDVRGIAVKVATRMNVMDDIRKSGTNLKGSSFVNSVGKRIVNFDDPSLFGMRQKDDAEIMRGDLAHILYQATKNDAEYIFNDSIDNMVQTDEGVTVTFRHSTPRNYDLVIGADGLRSNVRNLAFGPDDGRVKNFGYYLVVFTIPNHLQLNLWELSYLSPGRAINVYSLDNNETSVFLMFSSDLDHNHRDIAQQKKAVYENFIDAGWEMPTILKAMEKSDDFYFDSISQVYMENLSNGRVALLGDAGYCPSPASGQGTSMALVGAYILAGELAASAGDYKKAFYAYQMEMGPFIEKNQQLGLNALKQMFPKSKKQVWLQINVMRLLLHLPWKKKVLKGLFKRIQQKVDEAANGASLKNY